MASSPQKRKLSEMSPEEPVTSRSGRIRKPKVFYDPSLPTIAKRRSLPNMETAKSKKASKLVEPQPTSKFKKPENIPTQEKDETKMVPPLVLVKSAKQITKNNRRQTICGSTNPFVDDGTGCIVCGRSDIKKGRFVNCTDCDIRGHFTCLRNDKLFKTADQEHNWQCSDCKICKHCQKLNPNVSKYILKIVFINILLNFFIFYKQEQLYKCIICLSSYHLHCSSKFAPLPKSVVKKKFTCGKCMSAVKKPVELAPRSLIPNRKSEGFPGFPRPETAKVDPKPIFTEKSKKIVTFPIDQNSMSSKKSSADRKTENLERISSDVELKIKQEKLSPTPDREAARTEPYVRQLSAECNGIKKISVRKDLVETTKVESDVLKPESDDDKMDIEYDTKSIITPHESIPDVRKWDCDEVYIYFTAKAPEFAHLLKENQIDGDALLLIKREDVLNRFSLKLGPALRLYTHIIELQYKNNNPILAWNEF